MDGKKVTKNGHNVGICEKKNEVFQTKHQPKCSFQNRNNYRSIGERFREKKKATNLLLELRPAVVKACRKDKKVVEHTEKSPENFLVSSGFGKHKDARQRKERNTKKRRREEEKFVDFQLLE